MKWLGILEHKNNYEISVSCLSLSLVRSDNDRNRAAVGAAAVDGIIDMWLSLVAFNAVNCSHLIVPI